MRLTRRSALQMATGIVSYLVMPRTSWSQSYPTRPVSWLVGTTPGSSPDIFARLFGQRLSERLGQPFVVENKPGAGTNTAAEAVARAPADGYTMLMANAANAIGGKLYSNLAFDFPRDFSAVAGILSQPNVMVVNPAFPAKTIPEFIAHAKSNPGKVTMASAGVGTTSHISGELFQMMTGVKMLHVPYRGAVQPLTDIISGQVDVIFITAGSLIDHIKTGKLIALALTSTSRLAALPDVPTMNQYVPGYEASAWLGACMPRNTPGDIVAKVSEEIISAIAEPQISAQIVKLGAVPMPMKPGEFEKFLVAEKDKWSKVVDFAGIKPS